MGCHDWIVRWLVGLLVSLFLGAIAARSFLKAVRKTIGYKAPSYKVVPSWILGLVEGTFFTVAVAFDLSGVVIAMVGWITTKMAAHWNAPSAPTQLNIAAVRFSSLLGSMVSLFFAMLGGLICRGTLWPQ